MAAPERIRVCIRAGKEDWIGVAYAAETEDPSKIHEYARVTRFYFCSCGGALTAEEYITHYFEMGHDRGDPPASAAPVVDENDLISRAAAKAAMCNMCANRDRYKPAEALEGSMRLFHFQRSDNWNAGQCLAQAIDSLPAATAAPTNEEQMSEAGIQRLLTSLQNSCECTDHDPGVCLNGEVDEGSRYCHCECHTAAAPVEQSEHVEAATVTEQPDPSTCPGCAGGRCMVHEPIIRCSDRGL